MKMEPIVSSETSAVRTQMPEKYPKRNKLHLEHGESLKNKNISATWITQSVSRIAHLIETARRLIQRITAF